MSGASDPTNSPTSRSATPGPMWSVRPRVPESGFTSGAGWPARWITAPSGVQVTMRPSHGCLPWWCHTSPLELSPSRSAAVAHTSGMAPPFVAPPRLEHGSRRAKGSWGEPYLATRDSPPHRRDRPSDFGGRTGQSRIQRNRRVPTQNGEGKHMGTMDSVVAAHGPALLAYATRLTGGDRHAAEDVVQETGLRAWRHVDRLTEDRGSVRGWLMRVAHNIAIGQHRGRRARPTEVELPELDVPGTPVIPAPTDEVETRVVVVAVLDTLSTENRSTLVEVYS